MNSGSIISDLLSVASFHFSTEYNHIGCFATDSGPPMISLENNDPVLDGDYSTRENSVLKCLNAARRKGKKMFALKSRGECLSSSGDHLDVEAAYEESVECVNDKGGVNAMNVYVIKGKLYFQHVFVTGKTSTEVTHNY